MTDDRAQTDETERDLRLELMRLDREIKLLSVRRMDQQLVYEPIKLLLLSVGFAGALVALLIFFR